jgi:hypothetical protein
LVVRHPPFFELRDALFVLVHVGHLVSDVGQHAPVTSLTYPTPTLCASAKEPSANPLLSSPLDKGNPKIHTLFTLIAYMKALDRRRRSSLLERSLRYALSHNDVRIGMLIAALTPIPTHERLGRDMMFGEPTEDHAERDFSGSRSSGFATRRTEFMYTNRVRRTVAKALYRLVFAQAYLASYREGPKNRELFDGVGVYCMFIGYPRSGHSLIGSLLDAHPVAIIAHELDALKFVEAGVDRDRLYYLLLDNSQRSARREREWTGYTYKVPCQWQGRFDKLQIIGDKKGGKSTLQLAENLNLLHLLQKTVATDVKLIHVVRNPYDNIATIYKHSQGHKHATVLRTVIEDYFSRCETNADLKKRLKNETVLDVRHESFVDNPKSSLCELCGFLGIGYDTAYLEDCASIVFKSPHKSRYDIEWDAASLAAVRDGIRRFDFLKGYSYEGR